eukprot:TRINITY_DN31830_c0_g1_i1.p1 TRINITY_DN31830_c0_g1~~TRINITY_DN31830_c0_g1_i1.p1  ORF type:complete len:845 (+),score=198.11 TRINITY_DN31830_c0_g1_i1:68-2602(+)
MDEISAAEFEAREFDAREVVNRYRKRVPLPTLQKSLKGRYAASRQELVELINEKYADFVSLSSRMQGVERALKPLRAPLEESNDLTQSLSLRLGQLLDQANGAHSALAESRLRREALGTYVKNARLLDKAKQAIEQLAWGNPQESEDLMREHMVQERVARDLRNIRLNLGGTPGSGAVGSTASAAPANGELPAASPAGAEGGAAAAATDQPAEWTALLAEAASFEEVFATGLGERLQRLLAATAKRWEAEAAAAAAESPAAAQAAQTPSPPPRADLLAVSHLCRALVTLGRPQTVYAAFVSAFVESALASATAACQGSGALAADDARRPGTAAPLGSMDLGRFFADARGALLADNAPLLWFARRLRACPTAASDAAGIDLGASSAEADDAVAMAVPSLQLVSNAAVLPVLQHMQRVWPNVFMPAFPAVFAANYNHAARFLSDSEALMEASELRCFRRAVPLSDFRRRWKTQVYAQLRAKEAATRLDSAAAMDLTAHTADGAGCRRAADGQFWLQATGDLLRLLRTAWGDGWYLDTLYAKTAQLTVELVARYGRSLQGDASSSPRAGTAASAAEGATAAAAAASAALPAATAWDASAAAWAPGSAIVRAARAGADLLHVIDEVSPPGGIARLVLDHAPGGPDAQAAALARTLLQETAAELRPRLEALGASAVRQVATAVAPQFAAIRGIPAFYRMLDKPLPTRASPYVESALRPIQALTQQATQAGLPGRAAATWAKAAVDEAACEFASQAVQLLESTRQQEASLRRLTARAGAGADSRVSDLDKIQVQLCLDVDTFTKGATRMLDEVAGTAPSAEESPRPPGLDKLAAAVEGVWSVYLTHRPPS